MMEVTVTNCYNNNFNASSRDVYAESIYPIDSRILLVPLNEVEQKCWLLFQDIAKWRRVHLALFERDKICFEYGEASIELDHPYVPVVSDFAIAAFNELYRMYVTSCGEDHIYEAEIISVKYSCNCYGYTFFITLEAMEENVAGVYKATVLCHCDDGRRTLLSFIRSTSAAIGVKFKRMTRVIRDKSLCEDVKEQKKAIKAELKRKRNGGEGNGSAEYFSLKKDYKDMRAACHILDKYANMVEPIGWKIKNNNPDDWHVPNERSGLILRSVHLFDGYDYHNPLTVFSGYV